MNLRFFQPMIDISTYIRFKHLLVMVIVLFTGWVKGQELPGDKSGEVDTSTPYGTVYNHLQNLQDDNYKPEIAALSLDTSRSLEERATLAIKLKHVLDGKGAYINLDDVPRNVNFKDSVRNKFRYYPAPHELPELYLERKGNNWYYSEYSVNRIDEWHSDVYPFGTDKLLELLPRKGNNKYMGLYLWQYVGILIILIIAFVLHKLLTVLFEQVLVKLLLKYGRRQLAKELMIPIAKPISILLIFPVLMLFIPLIQLPIKLNSFMITGLQVAWPVVAVVFFYRLVDVLSIYMMRMAEKTESTLDDQLVPLLRKALKTFVVLIGLIFILDNLEVNITGLIAGISIGGLAFALAAQDTIKNFFGSLMIFFDRPFQVGDWITSGNVDGTVEEVGFRATRIRTFRNSVMYIPNGAITNQVIDNHGLRVYRRFFTTISVTYDTPAEVLESFVEGLKEITLAHPKTRKDFFEIHFNDLGASSLNIMFYIFFKVPTWSEELKCRHEILLSIINLAEELGINFAFPTQTLHVETFPEKIGNSPSYPYSTQELKKKVESFLSSGKKS